MANFGEALEALDEFRSALVDRQQNLPRARGQATAFRASTALASDSVVARVHATGVGVPDDADGDDDFVIKVYVFDRDDIAAARDEALLGQAHRGVGVDVQYLPVQAAFDSRKAPKAGARASPRASNPAQHRQRRRPVPGGVEIGPLGGNYVGTLGCFVRRGPGDDAPIFALSNNHVLADVNRLPVGSPFTQPFSAKPADEVARLASFEPLRFPAPGSQPRNVIDAAIAAVTDPKLVVLGRMLNLPQYTPSLLAARPGMQVVKAGRTTGVTRGTIRAVRVRGVQVNYGTPQMPIIATFDNAITITGAAGAPFSQPGDSGSAILEAQSGRPVALLFAGDSTTTTACDMTAVCSRFGVRLA